MKETITMIGIMIGGLVGIALLMLAIASPAILIVYLILKIV